MSSERLDEIVSELKSRRFYGKEFKARVDDAIDELLRIVMPPTGSGIPTRAQALRLFWLEKCKTKDYAVDEAAGDVSDDDAPVVDTTRGGRERDRYPQDPYHAAPFTATVHMPGGVTERWGPKRLRETEGGMIGNSLPWDTHYGAEMHYDPRRNRIFTVEGPNFRREAYEHWSQHH